MSFPLLVMPHRLDAAGWLGGADNWTHAVITHRAHGLNSAKIENAKLLAFLHVGVNNKRFGCARNYFDTEKHIAVANTAALVGLTGGECVHFVPLN